MSSATRGWSHFPCRASRAIAESSRSAYACPMREPPPVPHDFVLSLLAPLQPVTKPLFGCTAVYVGQMLVLVLRDRNDEPSSNGVWVATSAQHRASLRAEVPSLTDIGVLSPGKTAWQMIPVGSPHFEAEVSAVCAMVLGRDRRVGVLGG